MMLPLTFLLGAGASYPYGIPMMAGFYSEFRRHVEQKHPICFQLIQQFESTGNHSMPDLETLLSDLETTLKMGEGLSLVGKPSSDLDTTVQIARELRGYLDAFIVDTCERFERGKAVHDYSALVRLNELAPLHIFSTNYDRAVEFTCDSLGIRYSDGFESTSEPVASWTGKFDSKVNLIKLHGSVNWYIDDPGGALHRLDKGYSLPAYDFRISRKDQFLRPLMIIPTLEKEALGDPYINLSMHFTDTLKQAKVLIIAGNSLRDRHIRAFIAGRIDALHILLVGPHATTGREIFSRPERTHCLDAGFSEFLTLGHTALLRLAHTLLNDSSSADDVVGEAAELFVSEASQIIGDADDLSANPELAILWRQSKEGTPASRARAMLELNSYPHPAVVRHVIEVMQSDIEPAVRVAGVSTLAQLDPAKAVSILEQMLLSDASNLVQMESALALLNLKNERGAIAALENAAKAGLSTSVRLVIEEGLGFSG